MKIYRIAMMMLLVTAFACSSGNGNDDNKNKDDAQTSDVTGTTDTVAEDTSGGDDGRGQDVADDGISSDLAEDAAPDAVEPGETLSTEYLQHLCDDYCNASWGCDDYPYGVDCVDECIAKGLAEMDFAVKLLCARNGDDDNPDWSYCTQFEECLSDATINDACIPLCEDVVTCEAHGNGMFGYVPHDCQLMCSVGLSGEENAELILTCIGDALETCSGMAFLECLGDEPAAPCEELFCIEDAEADCLLIPDPYADVDACMAVCEDWNAGQAASAAMCAEASEDWPADCKETLLNCQNPPAELPEGAIEYCTTMAGKCGELLPMEFDMGLMGDEICGWYITGFTLLKPELFQPFSDGVTCLENLDICPSGDLSALYCMFDIPDEAKTNCQKVKELCTPEDYAAEMVMECEAVSAFISSFMADQLPTLYTCIEGAEDCQTLEDTCFFGDEE
jgi:hypothetical protein